MPSESEGEAFLRITFLKVYNAMIATPVTLCKDGRAAPTYMPEIDRVYGSIQYVWPGKLNQSAGIRTKLLQCQLLDFKINTRTASQTLERRKRILIHIQCDWHIPWNHGRILNCRFQHVILVAVTSGSKWIPAPYEKESVWGIDKYASFLLIQTAK